MHREATDGLLLEMVLSNNEAAWRELMRRYRPLMFRCIGKIAARFGSALTNEDVNEIFSELCVNLLRANMRKLRAYDSTRGCKLGTWLGMLAVHSTYDYLRQYSRRPLLDAFDGALDCVEPGPSAYESLLAKEERAQLGDLLADFSDKDRQFVELYYGSGLEAEEVASAMGISVKTVYSKKNKLRNKLLELSATTELLAA